MSLIYVAGSGPSVKGFDFAHVSTKKMKVDCDHVVLPRANWINPRNRMKAIVWSEYNGAKKWEKYYSGFKPLKWKPSNGLQAVFVAIDLYNPTEITLIGFDKVLDSAKPDLHEWPAELRCIKSLVKVIDPR